nr:MAG TPA: hypothetical protein [Caudoviricetes sp.]
MASAPIWANWGSRSGSMSTAVLISTLIPLTTLGRVSSIRGMIFSPAVTTLLIRFFRQLPEILTVVGKTGHPVCPGGFGGIHRTLNGGGRLFCSGAGDVHFRLDHMDGVHDVRERFHVVLHAGDLLRIRQQPLHFLFGAAVAQLQVVQHGVILFCEPLVGVLNGRHVRAHFVGVVGHVHDCHVGFVRRFHRVAAQGLEQGRRE